MFTHILFPTDGSELSERAIHSGIAMAKVFGARITGVTVTKPYHVMALDPMVVTDTKETYGAHADAIAADRLSVIEKAARAAGVPCQLVHRIGEHPYEEIIKTAMEAGHLYGVTRTSRCLCPRPGERDHEGVDPHETTMVVYR